MGKTNIGLILGRETGGYTICTLQDSILKCCISKMTSTTDAQKLNCTCPIQQRLSGCCPGALLAMHSLPCASCLRAESLPVVCGPAGGWGRLVGTARGQAQRQTVRQALESACACSSLGVRLPTSNVFIQWNSSSCNTCGSTLKDNHWLVCECTWYVSCCTPSYHVPNLSCTGIDHPLSTSETVQLLPVYNLAAFVQELTLEQPKYTYIYVNNCAPFLNWHYNMIAERQPTLRSSIAS